MDNKDHKWIMDMKDGIASMRKLNKEQNRINVQLQDHIDENRDVLRDFIIFYRGHYTEGSTEDVFCNQLLHELNNPKEKKSPPGYMKRDYVIMSLKWIIKQPDMVNELTNYRNQLERIKEEAAPIDDSWTADRETAQRRISILENIIEMDKIDKVNNYVPKPEKVWECSNCRRVFDNEMLKCPCGNMDFELKKREILKEYVPIEKYNKALLEHKAFFQSIEEKYVPKSELDAVFKIRDNWVDKYVELEAKIKQKLRDVINKANMGYTEGSIKIQLELVIAGLGGKKE